MPGDVIDYKQSRGQYGSKYKGFDMVTFVRASRHLKDLRKNKEAVDDILAAVLPHLYQDLKSQVRPFPCRSILLLARPRLDVCTMLLRMSTADYKMSQLSRRVGFLGSPSRH
jgi:hypothetical protein